MFMNISHCDRLLSTRFFHAAIDELGNLRSTIMSNFKTTRPGILLALILMISVCSTVANAQKGPQTTEGAPLKGVDVKLGKNPGGAAAARVTTDREGNFAFSVVPSGEYTLTLEIKKDASKDSLGVANDASLKYCYITINVPGGQKVKSHYDLKENKAARTDGAKQSETKIKLETLVVKSDGVTAISGTIVKSKSNISNN
jgi:hypothetical protein